MWRAVLNGNSGPPPGTMANVQTYKQSTPYPEIRMQVPMVAIKKTPPKEVGAPVVRIIKIVTKFDLETNLSMCKMRSRTFKRERIAVYTGLTGENEMTANINGAM